MNLVDARPGRHPYAPRQDHGRHRHLNAYAMVVVAGGCEEAGDSGRCFARAGEVLVHAAFDAHCNRFGARGAELLHIPLPYDVAPGAWRVADLDGVVRLAETDLRAARERLLAQMQPLPAADPDWPDRLAAVLRDGAPVRLSAWAEEIGLARETVSRGFAKAYGTSPIRFRADARALRAWRAIVGGSEPFGALAARLGFCDQAHMSREVGALTGRPPGWWRRWSQRSKTALALQA